MQASLASDNRRKFYPAGFRPAGLYSSGGFRLVSGYCLRLPSNGKGEEGAPVNTNARMQQAGR